MYGNDFYATQLNATSREIYNHFLSKFISKQISEEYLISVNHLSSALHSDAKIAITALSRDHPEFFFLSNKYNIIQRGNSLLFKNLICYSRTQIIRLEKMLERELFQITCGVMNFDEWERERTVYERVASRYQYQKHDDRLDFNVVGLLLREEGVCSAYANILILALRKARIACHRVSGGGHAWTMVYINDIPLHCDVTWESHKGVDNLSYSYFNITSAEISRDHVLPEHVLPLCSYKGYGFHKKQGSFFFSANEAQKYIRNCLRRGDRIIRIKTDCKETTKAIVKGGIRQTPFANVKYSINEKQRTAIIIRE